VACHDVWVGHLYLDFMVVISTELRVFNIAYLLPSC